MTENQKLDVSGRPTRLISPELEFLFSASSIAVVGATDTEGRQTTFAWRQLARWGSRTGAQVTPVHPTRESVDGVRTVTSLENLDHIPDVVAVLISDPLAAVQSAVAIGAKYVVVFAAGFSESGDAGKARQRALLDAIKGSETRLVGPNTNLNAFEWFDPSIAPKGLAILTQSGHQPAMKLTLILQICSDGSQIIQMSAQFQCTWKESATGDALCWLQRQLFCVEFQLWRSR